MLFLNQNFSDAACAALTVLSHSREDQSQEGALAVWATISLEETNKMHHMHFTLEVQWNTATNINRNTKQRGLSQNIIDVLGEYESSQSFTSQNDNSLLPQVFYEVACMPSHEDFGDLATVPIPGLESTLYPFQSRALQWLLMREGVKYNTINPDGGLQLAVHPSPPKSALPLSFRALYDVNGQRFYLSDLYHIVTRDITPFQEIENGLRGGILAEEMGLGKTVEMISLILTHKRSRVLPNELDIYNGTKIRPAGTTLIVTPDTLQAQWITEFKKHAPGLLVMKYPGMKVWANDKAFNKDHEGESLVARFISQLTNCDVVITTYSVLQAELHYAMAPPERSMRYERQHERHISPLVQIGWWRICLDEAQQIDSGVSSAARVARLIPRVNAWAVTGTPVKNDLNDLWGLLLFLRYDPFASSRVVWNALLKTYQTYFAALFNSISIRHSKRAVRDELELPSQKRFIVTIPFTSIEEHHYQSQFKSLVEKAGLSQQGTPLRADWEKDDPSVVDLMKKALASLRQTILHPELGSASARAVAYRTLAEHLENMIELSEARIKAEQRVYLIHKIQRGKVCEILPRVKEAIRIWEEVLEEVKPIILECREDLRRALEHARREQEKEANNRYDEEKASNEDTLETGKVGECRRRLRLILDVEHRATFHLASGFFQLKSNEDMTLPGSDEYQRLDQRETEGYELAQAIRREVLEDPLIKASKLMGRLKERAESQSFVEIPEIVTSNLHGMESGQIVEDLETLGASLNEQADIIDEWREHVIQLLLKPLVDTEGDEEITGAEYEDSTKVQEHLMVYTRALGAIIGDRQEALSGLVNERISYETTTAERMAKDGEGHAPEKMLELLRIRGYVKPKPHGCSFRRSVAVLRELCTKLRHDASVGSNRARLELQIVTTQLRATQDLLTKQSKAALSLERDLDFFTAAMNARVEFYRQLQSVSDSVAPLSEDHVDVSWNQVYEMNLAGEDQIKVKIQNLESNHRHREFPFHQIYCSLG
jgi:E3 ubiquitin-protein ligase SHPRH